MEEKKTIKTGISLDLGISLVAGVPFLGRYEVPRPVRVAIYSGESGEATLHGTAARIMKAKGLGEMPDNLRVCTRLPSLSDKVELEALQAELEEFGAEVLIIDPIYLCLALGGKSLNPAILFEVGPLLKTVTDFCKKAGCTFLFNHHSLKDVKVGQLPGLDDLAYAGFREFVRQWFLLNHRRAYDKKTGHARLYFCLPPLWGSKAREDRPSARRPQPRRGC